MTNVTQLRPTVKRTITVHRITKELMPQKVKDNLIDTAINLQIVMENEFFEIPSNLSPDLTQLFEDFRQAVEQASRYTVPYEQEVDEPVHQ